MIIGVGAITRGEERRVIRGFLLEGMLALISCISFDTCVQKDGRKEHFTWLS